MARRADTRNDPRASIRIALTLEEPTSSPMATPGL
jgi:hypothetical protein